MVSSLYLWLAALDVLCLAVCLYLVFRLARSVRTAHFRINGLAEKLQYPVEQVRRLTETFETVLNEEMQATVERIEARLDPTKIKEKS